MIPNDDPVQYSRAKMQLLPVKKRKNNFQEVELPWADAVAVREAKRCLQMRLPAGMRKR